MQIKLFTIPVAQAEELNEELNAFLRGNKIVDIEKHLGTTPGGSAWCFAISYIPKTVKEQSPKKRVDYKAVLGKEVFARFSKLREIRKEIAARENISAFMVFTDAELAEIAKLDDMSTARLQKIKGIGKTKAEKYGTLLIEQFNANHHETQGPSDTGNSQP